MRTSEYYAQGIHSFFVGFGLDAIERSRAVAEVPVDEPASAVRHDDLDMDFDDYDGCRCAVTAWPPCSYCEDGHDAEAAPTATTEFTDG